MNEGPYKPDGCYVVREDIDKAYRCKSEFDAIGFAEFANKIRAAAIEECVETGEAAVNRRFPKDRESCVSLRGACWCVTDALRALINNKEPDRAE